MSPSIAYLSSPESFLDLDVRVDEELNTAFYCMRPRGRQVFSSNLLHEMKSFFNQVRADDYGDLDFIVSTAAPGRGYNYGGDLDLFAKAIEKRDVEGLFNYGKSCIDVLYDNYTALKMPLTTVCLVQGDALGGGFEAALSCQVIVAEKGVNMGFPEILFNLFPGMGAYQLLTQRLDATTAKKMILSGKLYSSEELYDMGIIDVLADKGMGEIATAEYIEKARRNQNGRIGLSKVMLQNSSFDYASLEDNVRIWSECAMNLSSRDLKMMSRLIRKQSVKSEEAPQTKNSYAIAS